MENKKIFINDLLGLENVENIKVRFNLPNGSENPMDVYEKNPELINNQWFLWRNKTRYFNVGDIGISLLRLTQDTWLLTTIKAITNELGIQFGINYEADVLEEFSPFFGRVIIKYRKSFQTPIVKLQTVIDQLEVLQILPSHYDGKDFPGYDKTRLSFQELETIIIRNKKDWIAALNNQKAVYLISDTHTGKLYVGSATGDNGMLLQRWTNYIENGHGGNIELKTLVDTQGFEYVKKNFQYSILENYNARVDTNVILARESWWKEVLLSRLFGYNAN